MSSAVYPLGMRPVPSSGYNHKSSMSTQYVTWKGTGLSKTPTGVTSGTIRPLTNKDYGNNYPAPFGKARPIKHARKGYVPRIPVADIETDRNLNRDVKSSTNGSLVKQMIDTPGGFSVKENTLSDAAPNCGAVCVVWPLVGFETSSSGRRKSQSALSALISSALPCSDLLCSGANEWVNAGCRFQYPRGYSACALSDRAARFERGARRRQRRPSEYG